MPGKTINKNRSSKDYTNGQVVGNQTTRTRGKVIENINTKNLNNNDYDGVIGNVNNNDFEGIGTNETTKESGTVFGGLYPNVLHQFASYNTIFTLSGIREQEMRTFSFLKNAPHDIIARTGGIGDAAVTDEAIDTQTVGDTDDEGGVYEKTLKQQKFDARYLDSVEILRQGHDIFIENVNIISTAGPNSERNLGNFTKMEFQMHEPFGITLLEKLRAAAAVNRFLDYQAAPFLLTIEFRGFDENGQPYKASAADGAGVRKIPILITRVEFDVSAGGAQYSVTAVPYSDLAYDDAYKFPRTTISLNTKDPVAWARQIAVDLDAGMQNEIDESPPMREFKDTYEFSIHPDVIRQGQKYKNDKETIQNTADIRGARRNSEQRSLTPTAENANTSVSDGISLTKYFEDAIRNAYGYQTLAENFWVAYLRGSGVAEERLKTVESVSGIVGSSEIKEILLQNSFVDWFKIKTSVETDTSRIDSVTKMHPKKIIYQAIPHKIHVLKLIRAGMGIKDVDFGKHVNKEYNYIYTGDNIDVQNLRINYKAAYYMRNVRSKVDTIAERGLFTHVEEAFKSVFGKNRDPEPLLPLRQYPSTIKGRSTVDTGSAESNKAQEFYDYLTNPEADMVRIELDILGDPAYICQDLYMPIHSDRFKSVGGKNRTFDVQRQSFNADQFMPMIKLNYRMPSDIEELEGTSFSAKKKYRGEQLFFNGIYQVNKIESKFEQGQFLQTLYCTRMNNQAGVTEDVALTNSVSKDTAKLKNIDLEEAAKKAAENKARKIASENFGLGAYD